MRKKHLEQRARQANACSPVNGTGRRTSAKIACVGVSALIAGQLFMPSVSLAAEAANHDAATNDAVAVAAPTTAAAATTAPATATASAAAPAAKAASTADAALASAAQQQQTVPQQAQPATAATPGASTGSATVANQNSLANNATTPANDAIMPCGVTDVVSGEGGIKVNTTVVNHFTDCALPSNVTLTKGQPYTYDFPEVEGGIPDEPLCELAKTKYYRADAASGTLSEVQDASMSDVTARFEPVGNHMRLTLTFTGGAASGSYRLTRNETLYIGASLTYTSTDYEGGHIIVGNPDDIFNAYKPGGSVVINETRDEYYIRYAINSEITLVASENEALENLNVNDVKTDYAPGEAPRATATIPAADADKYEIAYECWEEMDGSDPAELTPVAFWYSDPAKYTPGMKKIDHFEEGKFYMYSVELRLKGDNTVADDCEMNVNGHWAHYIKTVNGVLAPNADNMLCEQPIDEWRAIDVIEINGATTTFKAGDKPVFTANVPTGSSTLPQCEFWTGSDGSEVNSVKFWDQNITNHIAAFKPGVTYRYGIYLKSARGFYFTPSTKLVINGQECGYEVADGVSDPDSGWIYTLWLNTDLTFTPEAAPAPVDPEKPAPQPEPTPQPGDNNGAEANTDKPVKAATAPAATKPATAKPTADAIPTTGDDAALTAAALGVAGATAVVAGVAAARRRNH